MDRKSIIIIVLCFGLLGLWSYVLVPKLYPPRPMPPGATNAPGTVSNLANPLALLMSSTMMLKHLADTRGDEACRNAGERIRRAYDRALEEGQKTRDIGGSLGTTEFARAVSDRLEQPEIGEPASVN